MGIDWERARWRKSSHSDTGGCVEVARAERMIGVRDAKAASCGPILEFSETEWAAFLAGVADGEFSLEALRR
jgi:hypothetical protein